MQQFSIEEAFKQGWTLTKKNLGFLIGVFIVVVLVNLVFSAGLNLLQKNLGGEGASPVFYVLYLIVYILSIVVSSVLTLGVTKITLTLADQKQAVFNDLFSCIKFFWTYIGASILYGLIVTGGLFLVIIPGIRWAVKYQFFTFFIIDRNAGVVESLKLSGAVTRGHKWPLFFLIILLMLLNLLGLLVLFVGLLVTVPLTMMVSVVAYRMLCQKVPSNEVEKAKMEGVAGQVAQNPA